MEIITFLYQQDGHLILVMKLLNKKLFSTYEIRKGEE
jgi:hypothetical protein